MTSGQAEYLKNVKASNIKSFINIGTNDDLIINQQNTNVPQDENQQEPVVLLDKKEKITIAEPDTESSVSKALEEATNADPTQEDTHDIPQVVEEEKEIF